MIKPAAFTATCADWKLVRTRKVVQVVFEVPVEAADIAYQVIGGMPHPGESKWFAIARLNQEPAAAEQSTERMVVPSDIRTRNSTASETTPASDTPAPMQPVRALYGKQDTEGNVTVVEEPLPRKRSLAQRIGRMCNDKMFQTYLHERLYGICESSADAAEIVRTMCCVQSRSEITEGTQAAHLWHTIEAGFDMWRLEPAVGL